jgi:hypothetical protein
MYIFVSTNLEILVLEIFLSNQWNFWSVTLTVTNQLTIYVLIFVRWSSIAFKIQFCCSSSRLAWQWRWWQCIWPKRQRHFTSWHAVKSQQPRIFSSIAENSTNFHQVICLGQAESNPHHTLCLQYTIMIWYIFNCNMVDTRWQQYSTHLHTNSTENSTMIQNTQNITYITIRIHKHNKRTHNIIKIHNKNKNI